MLGLLFLCSTPSTSRAAVLFGGARSIARFSTCAGFVFWGATLGKIDSSEGQEKGLKRSGEDGDGRARVRGDAGCKRHRTSACIYSRPPGGRGRSEAKRRGLPTPAVEAPALELATARAPMFLIIQGGVVLPVA